MNPLSFSQTKNFKNKIKLSDIIQSSEHSSDSESEEEGEKKNFWWGIRKREIFEFFQWQVFVTEQGLLIVCRIQEKTLKHKLNGVIKLLLIKCLTILSCNNLSNYLVLFGGSGYTIVIIPDCSYDFTKMIENLIYVSYIHIYTPNVCI